MANGIFVLAASLPLLHSLRGMLCAVSCAVLQSSEHAFQDTIFSLANPQHGCHQLWSDYLASSHWIWKGLMKDWPIFLFRYWDFGMGIISEYSCIFEMHFWLIAGLLSTINLW
jgi:hypothetical protein